MSPELLGFGSLGLVLLLIAIRMPIGVALGVVAFLGFWFLRNERVAFAVMQNTPFEVAANWGLSAIPMFILMGSLFFHTGLAIRVFDALDKLLGKIPGRLCFLTVAGGTMFSCLTGSSMANTAMLGSLLVPEMQRRGYNKRMSMGPILGTGGLAMIIPPSSLGVLLASIANVDVGQLLIAGVIPGFLLAGLYAGIAKGAEGGVTIEIALDVEASQLVVGVAE